MLTVALLALSLSQSSAAQPSKLEQMAQPTVSPAAAAQAVSVVLDCQIASKSLTDCKAVNEVANATVVAEAIRLAGGVAVPDALADTGVRIRIRMNVAP